MSKYHAKMTLKIPGSVETDEPFEADDIDDLVSQVSNWRDSGGGDELVEKDWDNCDDYQVVSVTDEAGKEVFTPEQLTELNAGSTESLEEDGEPWLIDLPNVFGIGTEDDSWKNIHKTKTKAEAIAWIRENVGHCDDDGNIGLLSYCPQNVSA